MKIANPLYDTAFKYLMQNNRIAKKVLSTLLECEVLELVVEQQEIVVVDESRGLKLYRLDFSAVIVDGNGKKQKILIELQKSKLPTNILRFRSYLGDSYAKRELIVNEAGVEVAQVYPIISIYILGYNVVDIPYLSVNIDNKITNTITKEEVKVTSDFIELLTHKTRIIQIRRLPPNRQSRLERFLMLFNQAWISSERVTLILEEVPEEFSDVATHLQGAMKDEDFRKRLKAEEEVDAIFRNQEAELAAAWQQTREAKQEVLKEKRLKQQAKQGEKQAKQREKQAKQEQHATQIQFAKHLLKQGTPISDIAKITALDEKTIKDIKQ